MGFARDRLSDASLADIARSLFTVKSEERSGERHELHGLCPFHSEKNPSFSYSIAKDAYNCLACSVSGDLIDLWCHKHGYQDRKEGFKVFVKLYGLEDKPTGAVKNKSSKTESSSNTPIIPPEVWDKFGKLPQSWTDKLLATKGWSKQAIDELDLRLQTHYLDKNSDKVKKISGKPERIAIPIFDDSGKLRNIRCYKPKAKVNKITSWGKGYGNSRLYPAGVTLNPDLPIVICEGEPDTNCARSLGLNAITQTSKLVKWPKDHLIHFKNRDVIIAYDADQAGIKYANHAAESLHPVAKSVRLLEWPDYMGRLADSEWPKNHGQDLTDFFITHKKTIEDWQELVGKIPKYVPKEPEAPPVKSSAFFKYNSKTKRSTFMPRWLADRILDDLPLMYDPKTGILYRWGGRFWEEYFEENIKKRCLVYLGDDAKKERVNDATFQARLLSTLPHGRSPNDNMDLICINNGMLDLKSLELHRHQKDYYSTYQLDVDYWPNPSKKCDRWLSYLEQTIQIEEQIMQAQEFAGYCLTRETRFAKALFLIGPGNDGKSLYLKILRLMCGPQNCTAVSFKDIEDQFYRSALYNKLLNISTEVGSRALESAYFKAIVTGDPISAAFKNRDPFEFLPFCKLAFASNKLPRVLDNTDGFFRRVLPIDFKRQFVRGVDEDTQLLDKLKEELSQIFLWALAGLHRLWDQDGFTDCDQTHHLLMEYKRANNPVLCFVEEICELGSEKDFTVEKDDLYRQYKKYSRRMGYTPMHHQNFHRELNTAVNNLRTYRPRLEDGSRPRVYKGIRLNPDLIEDENPEPEGHWTDRD